MLNNLIMGVFVLLLAVLAFVVPFSFVGHTDKVKKSADEGWYYIDYTGMVTSQNADLKDLQFDENTNLTSIATTINSDEISGANLEFISTNVDFSVYLDDELIYDFNPVLPIYSGKSYGNAVHDIIIPNFSGNATLRIDAKRLGEDMYARFSRAYFQNGYMFYRDLLADNLYKLVMTFVVFVLGLFLTVLANFFEYRENQRLEAVSIGVTAMILALYTNSDVFMLEVFAANLGILRFINYLTLILLPVPGLTLVMTIERFEKSRGLLFIEILVLFNAICHIVVIGSGNGDYHDLLIMTHCIFVVTVLVAIGYTILAFISKRIREDSQLIMLIAFGLLMTAGLIDLVSYYIGSTGDVARFSRVGLFIFTVVISFYEIIRFFNISRKSYEAEIMEKLAHQDGLTGLENRMSFSEYEKELSLRPAGIVFLIQFDINYLKKVNDNFGHSEGDKQIVGAANVIKSIFGDYSRIFRTGGDEFIVAMESNSVMNLGKTYRECERRFADAVEAYNEENKPPIPLSIAYGMSEMKCGEDSPEDVEKKADKRMYEHKLRIKKQESTETVG